MPLKFLPNTLSFIRLLLVLPFVYYFYSKHFSQAAIVFVIAALTDALDGWLARSLKCQSDFGLIIDPVADKVLIVSCFILLGYHHILPLGLVILVISRDFSITFSAFLYLFVFKTKNIFPPSLLSKLNTVLQMLLICTYLFHLGYHPVPQIYLQTLNVIVAFTTSSSFIHYFWLWYQTLHQTKRHDETA